MFFSNEPCKLKARFQKRRFNLGSPAPVLRTAKPVCAAVRLRYFPETSLLRKSPIFGRAHLQKGHINQDSFFFLSDAGPVRAELRHLLHGTCRDDDHDCNILQCAATQRNTLQRAANKYNEINDARRDDDHHLQHSLPGRECWR